MEEIIEKSKNEFINRVNKYKKDPYLLLPHVPEAEKWAKYLLKKYPKADSEIVLISVWLHDIGHYPITDEDHAITSEKLAREFLNKINYDKTKLERVLHCVRAHRCKDVAPITIEAKIMAASDSASHMTDSLYLNVIRNGAVSNTREGSIKKALDKLERDYRDVSIFPEIKVELKPLYEAWKQLLSEYGKIKLD